MDCRGFGRSAMPAPILIATPTRLITAVIANSNGNKLCEVGSRKRSRMMFTMFAAAITPPKMARLRASENAARINPAAIAARNQVSSMPWVRCPCRTLRHARKYTIACAASTINSREVSSEASLARYHSFGRGTLQMEFAI
jgi:hypothetical protein